MLLLGVNLAVMGKKLYKKWKEIEKEDAKRAGIIQ